MTSRWLLVVLGAAVAGLGAWGLVLSRQLTEVGQGLVDTTAHVAQMSTELDTTRADADLLVDLLGVLRAGDLRRIELQGQATAAAASGRMFAGRRGLLLLTDRLPALGHGRTYQLWVTSDEGRPVSAGTFEVNAFGMATVVAQAPVGPSAAVTVSEEPAGGSPSPTSQAVLAGRPVGPNGPSRPARSGTSP
jgi:uncharacterized protein YidB (DUF937 family)